MPRECEHEGGLRADEVVQEREAPDIDEKPDSGHGEKLGELRANVLNRQGAKGPELIPEKTRANGHQESHGLEARGVKPGGDASEINQKVQDAKVNQEIHAPNQEELGKLIDESRAAAEDRADEHDRERKEWEYERQPAQVRPDRSRQGEIPADDEHQEGGELADDQADNGINFFHSAG